MFFENADIIINMKMLSWNVNGIRAIHKKGFLEWILKENPDVLCLQEVKAEEGQIPKDLQEIPGYFFYVYSAQKKGTAEFCLWALWFFLERA